MLEVFHIVIFLRFLEFFEINKSLRKLEKKVYKDIFSPSKLPIKYLKQILFNECVREREREITREEKEREKGKERERGKEREKKY